MVFDNDDTLPLHQMMRLPDLYVGSERKVDPWHELPAFWFFRLVTLLPQWHCWAVWFRLN